MKTLFTLKTLLSYLALALFLISTPRIYAQNKNAVSKKIIKIIEIDENGDEINVDTLLSFGGDIDFDFDFNSADSGIFERNIDSLVKNLNIDIDIDFDNLAGDFEFEFDSANFKYLQFNDTALFFDDDAIQSLCDSLFTIDKLGLVKSGIWVISDEKNDTISKIIIKHNDSDRGGEKQEIIYKYYTLESENQPLKIKTKNGLSREIFIYDIGESDIDYLQQQKIISKDYQSNNAKNLKFYSSDEKKQFTINLSLDKKTDVKINIYNLSGKKVYSTEIETNEINESIDFSSFGGGTYFLEITLKKQSFYKKIILN